MHQNRLNQEAAAYKAEIELTMQKQRLREEAEEKIAQTRREADMLERESEKLLNSEQPMTTNEPNSLRKRNRRKSDSENLRLR